MSLDMISSSLPSLPSLPSMPSMPSMVNPLTEERLNQIKDDTATLLKEFSRIYLCKCGLAVLSQLETTKEIPWRLSHRPWNAVKREHLSSGYLFVRSGAGPGAFDKWKKVFVVERQDYGIDLFANEMEYTQGKKAKATIQVVGYDVVSDVSEYYKEKMGDLKGGMSLTLEDVDTLTAFSGMTFALAHFCRTNYIFQVHEAKSPFCFCLAGSGPDPDDSTDEERHVRSDWIDLMERCTRKSEPRDRATLAGIAFEKTFEAIPRNKKLMLEDFKDDGKESEMLVSLLIEKCLAEVKDAILKEIMGPLSIRLMLWYKCLGVIQTTLQKMIDPAWTQVLKASQEVEKQINKAMEPVRKVKQKAEDKIKSLVLDRIGALLAQYVSPFIEPLLKAVEKPLAEAFQFARKVITEQLDISKLPDCKEERDRLLNAIPRQLEVLNSISQITSDLLLGLEKVTKMNTLVFEGLDVKTVRQKAEDIVLEVLDAAFYSVQVRLDDGSAPDDALVHQLLRDYDHDVLVARSNWMKTTVREILLPPFKKLIQDVTEPVIEQANEEIPEEMRDFLDLKSILDALIDFLVGEPIDKMHDR